MLILTRKKGETLRIGDEIKIQIIEVQGRQIKIGIEAPQSIVVMREELLSKTHSSKDQSSK